MNTLSRLRRQNHKGFTLIEVLMVVAIIAILAGIVIIAVNPGKQLADTRNAQRQADVTTILNAAYQYSLDAGSLPSTVTATPTQICKTGGTCTSLVDLTVLTANGKYLVALPSDPQCPGLCNANGDGYTIAKDATTGRITVAAPNAENGRVIAVTR